MCSSGGGGLASRTMTNINNMKIAAVNQKTMGGARPGTYITATNSYTPGDDGSSLGNGTSRRRPSLLTAGSGSGGLKTLLGQ